MSEEVVYSDVTFIKKTTADRTDPEQCHLGDSSQASQNKPCCDRVRLILLALCTLLMGGLIALSFQYVNTERKLEDLVLQQNAMNATLIETVQGHNHCQRNLSEALNNTVNACPKNWKFHAGKCYFFSTDTLLWTKSRDACISDGGHLVIINSREEQEFLMLHINKESYWIGLTDEKNEGQWLWVDNTALSESFWSKNEPDDWKGNNAEFIEGEDCARMQEYYSNPQSWYDEACHKLHRRICETKSPKQT